MFVISFMILGDSYLSHIATTNSNDLGTGSHGSNVLSSSFSLFDIAANDARIGSQANQRSGLHAANSASTTGNEDYLSIYRRQSV